MPRRNPSPRPDDHRSPLSQLAWPRVARDHMTIMEFNNPSDAEIRAILSKPATVAVVGCSDNPARDSLRIAKLLKSRGFKVIPVNPQLDADALRSRARREMLPRPRVDSRAGRDSGRIPPLGVRPANRRGGNRQRRAHPLVPARRDPPRRRPPRAKSRHDSHDGSMPRNRIRAPVLRECAAERIFMAREANNASSALFVILTKRANASGRTWILASGQRRRTRRRFRFLKPRSGSVAFVFVGKTTDSI